METKKTRFSTSRKRASEDHARIDTLIDALTSREPDDLSEGDYESLSDLSRPAAQRLAERWSDIPRPVRIELIQHMVALYENDVQYHFDKVLIVALDDPEDDIKLSAFQGLTESVDPRLFHYLTTRLPQESNVQVRAAGALLLGQFVVQAESDKLDERTVNILRETILTLMEQDESEVVRLHALESAGYLAGNPAVVDAIEDAWDSERHDAQVSALRAMGRQSDPRWLERVLSEFASDEPEIRFEAARAVGTLGGQRTVPKILDLTEDEDTEVQMAAVASLGMIGGESAIRALRGLTQSESVAIADAAGAALDEALLLDNPARPPNSMWQA